MASIELAARRGVDHCVNLLKSPHLTASEVIDDARNNRNQNIQIAGEQLSILRSQLKNDVKLWIETNSFSGILAKFRNEKVAEYLGEIDDNLDDYPEPLKTVIIPTLDMSSLRLGTPNDSGVTRTPRTPLVSDIGSYLGQEVVEVSDSSVNDDHLSVPGPIGLTEPDIPTVRVPLPRSENLDFSRLPLNFIPSSPLKERRIKTTEAAVQTQRETEDTVRRADAATSYSSQHFQDVGEVSTSENSDPSLGQISQSNIPADNVISVLIDGSLLQKDAIRDWKSPLELVRIAEKDISSSFGSEEIESVSAKGMTEEEDGSGRSDEETTVNQVSAMESDAGPASY